MNGKEKDYISVGNASILTGLDAQTIKKITTSEIELAEDLLSIVRIYSCRQMGKRSYSKNRVEDDKNKDLSDKDAEEIN
jgi:predicted site-specific integrase-resolvase